MQDLHVVASEFKIGDDPVVDFVGPFASPLDPHVLLRWHKLVDNQVFEPYFPCELTNSVHQVLALSVNNVSDVVKVSLRLLVLAPNLVYLLVLRLKLILFAAEVLSQIYFDVLLRLKFLLK